MLTHWKWSSILSSPKFARTVKIIYETFAVSSVIFTYVCPSSPKDVPSLSLFFCENNLCYRFVLFAVYSKKRCPVVACKYWHRSCSCACVGKSLTLWILTFICHPALTISSETEGWKLRYLARQSSYSAPLRLHTEKWVRGIFLFPQALAPAPTRFISRVLSVGPFSIT